MKLFVYCPEQYNGKKDSPEWEIALQLSKNTKLPIVSNIEKFNKLDVPQVVSMPEKSFYDIDQEVKLGFVQRIDITNEFYCIDSTVTAYFIKTDGDTHECKPTVKETHKVKFRARHYQKGAYAVVVKDKDNIYLESSFTVV